MNNSTNRPERNLKTALEVVGMGVLGVAIALAPPPWDSSLIAASAFALLTLFVVRRLNRRDDPCSAKRPPETP